MRIFLYLSIIFVMAFSFVLVRGGDTFPFVLPFCIAPIIIAGYLYGIIWAYLVSAVLTAFCIGLTKLGLEVMPMLLSIAGFNIAPLVIFRFNGMMRNYKSDCKKRIGYAGEGYQELLDEDKKIKEVNAGVERDVLEMAHLYEMTRAMSVNMEFPGVFSVLRNILEKTFKFTSAKLILISKKSDGRTLFIRRVYSIKPGNSVNLFEKEKNIKLGAWTFLGQDAPLIVDEASEGIAEHTPFDRVLVELYSAQRQKSLIIKAGGPDSFGGRLRLPEGVKVFIAVGLFYEGGLIGILSVENITEEQLDRFLIVAGQFELELQKVKLYEMVQRLAVLDGLTGLFVRRYLLERCQEELRRSMKHKLNLSCLVVDIDFFKACNDKYGHLVGDEVLRQLALIIKASIREVDFAGRYGGEEFCVILPDTLKEGAAHVAERLRASVEEHAFKAYDESIKMTVSIGAALFPEDANDMNQLIDCADRTMYKAKGEGRNRVCVYK